MTEKELIGLNHGLNRLISLYLRQKTEAGKERYNKIIKEYAKIFREECNAYYHDNKKASEWGNYLRDKEKEEFQIKSGNSLFFLT